MPPRYRHKIPLLTGRFKFADQKVYGGHARLFGDRIELDGWRLGGRFKQRIPLIRIVDMDYHPLDEEGNLTLYLDDQQEIRLVMQDAHRWRQAFESWLSYHVLASAKIMSEEDLANAIAG